MSDNSTERSAIITNLVGTVCYAETSGFMLFCLDIVT